MKKLNIILILIALFPVHGFAQTLPFSTVGQVYNFAAGDTFETGCSYNPGDSNGLSMDVVLQRQDSGDSIIYKILQNSFLSYLYQGQNLSNSDSVTFIQIYSHIDSSIFWYHTHRLGCDTTCNCYTDTAYRDTALYNWKVNEHDQGCRFATWADTLWADGLGEIRSNTGAEPIILPHTYCNLIYYHKANGDIWGTPVYFNLITGIKELTDNEIFVQIFHNHATNILNIKVEGAQPETIAIYNLTGQKIIECNFTPTLNTAPLSAGVYFIEVKLQGEAARRKFVKIS